MKIFYDNEETGICIFEQGREIYRIDNGDITKLEFRQFIREIDTKPEVRPEVKREIIIDAAKIVGMLV